MSAIVQIIIGIFDPAGHKKDPGEILQALSAPRPDSNGVGDRSQARMCGEPSSPADRARSRRRRRCASSRRISDLSVNAPRRPHRRCSASNLCGRGNFARSGCRSAAGGEAVDDVLGAVTTIPLIWGSDGRLERNRKFVDSPLEGRVRSEPVSEAGFSGAGELRPDSKMFMDDAARRNGGYFGAHRPKFGLCPSAGFSCDAALSH